MNYNKQCLPQVGEKAMLGKVMDLETRGDPTLSVFDMTTYSTISKYRTSYHTFKLPVALALYMARHSGQCSSLTTISS